MADRSLTGLPLDIILDITDALEPEDLLRLLQILPWLVDWLPSRQLAKAADSKGNTVLHYLSRLGCHDDNYDELCRRILGRPVIDINVGNRQGFTPLDCAVSYSREKQPYNDLMIDMLLARPDIQVNKLGIHGTSPLMVAAGVGVARVVEKLIARDDVDINLAGTTGFTALMYACYEGRPKVVSVLLAHPKISPGIMDINLRTPLSHAAQSGNTLVIRMLLGLYYEPGPYTLTEAQVSDINAACQAGRTPLMYAVLYGAHRTARLLLALPEVNVNREDEYTLRTSLSYAAEAGDAKMVVQLLARSDIVADRRDGVGRTPLSYAVAGGHLEVARMLLENEQVDAGALDEDGRSPLVYALMARNTRMVRLVQQNMDWNSPYIRDVSGREPYDYARVAGSDFEHIVEDPRRRLGVGLLG